MTIKEQIKILGNKLDKTKLIMICTDKMKCQVGQVFNKGLKTDEKQEDLLKRLENIEDKTDNQLKAIKDNKDSQLSIKAIDYIVKEELLQEAKSILKKLSNQEKIINYRKLYLKGG